MRKHGQYGILYSTRRTGNSPDLRSELELAVWFEVGALTKRKHDKIDKHKTQACMKTT